MLLQRCFIAISVFLITLEYVWSASNNCSQLRTKPTPIDRQNKYSLWPELMSAYDLENGEILPGFYEAMEIIWKNQNPPDCSKAKYLIGEPFLQGVGSELHVHGVGLSIAIATNRVFLQHGGWSWRFKNPHCAAQNKQSMECYYMPVSKCTLHDAMATMKTIHPDFPQPDPFHLGNATAAVRTSRALSIKPRPPHKAPHNAAANPANPANSGNNHHNSHNGNHNNHNNANGHHAKSAPVVWSAREDADLEGAIIKYGVQGHWQQIAAVLAKSGSSKTDIDCLYRFRNFIRRKLNTRAGPSPKGKTNFNDDHALVDLLVEGYGVVAMSRVGEVMYDAKSNNMKLWPSLADKLSDNVMMISFKVMLEQRKYVANEFSHLLRCVGMAKKGFSHWWWRAVSASFFLRPNVPTLDLLRQHGDPVLRDANGQCVSAYVRHGDKGIEMSLIPFSRYADAAYCMWQSTEENHPPTKGGNNTTARTNCAGFLISADNFTAASMADKSQGSGSNKQRRLTKKAPLIAHRPQDGKGSSLPALTSAGATMPPSFAHIQQPLLRGYDGTAQRVFYLGSEDPLVFSQATEWARLHNINLRYSNISQVLLSDRQGIMKHRDMETSMPANRQMEYFSYLLHLSDLVKCRGFVCTLASNYCRLVDELRATVGGKANAYFADLSAESCRVSPCVRPFSMADYKGPVYDPTLDTLWRK